MKRHKILVSRIKNNYHLIIQRRKGTGCTTIAVDFGCICDISRIYLRKQNTALLHANVYLNLANFFYTTGNRLSIIGQLMLSCNFSCQIFFLLAMATKNNGCSLKGCAKQNKNLNVLTIAFALPLHYLSDPCG